MGKCTPWYVPGTQQYVQSSLYCNRFELSGDRIPSAPHLPIFNRGLRVDLPPVPPSLTPAFFHVCPLGMTRLVPLPYTNSSSQTSFDDTADYVLVNEFGIMMYHRLTLEYLFS